MKELFGSAALADLLHAYRRELDEEVAGDLLFRTRAAASARKPGSGAARLPAPRLPSPRYFAGHAVPGFRPEIRKELYQHRSWHA